MCAEPLNHDGPTRAPIDFDYLRRFTRGDAALETEVLELFRQHARATVGQLAASSSDDEWRIASHTLKGSARAVGAWSVAAAAEHAESAGAGYEQRPAAVAGIKRALDAVCAFLEMRLSDGGAKRAVTMLYLE